MAEVPQELLTVLVAEDDLTSRLMMESFLRRLGYLPISAPDGLAAWTILSGENPPMLALLDWEMPEMDGLEVVRKVRQAFPDKYFYLIMVTAKNSKEAVVECLGQGADDYVTKPFDSKELGVRIRVGYRIIQLQKQLLAANHRLIEMAKTDRLTGCLNRQAFHQDFSVRSEESLTAPYPKALIMADIDHFKNVNDNFGHCAGDTILEEFAGRIKNLLRSGDSVYRMGGEEFLIVIPQASEDRGVQIAERIRKSIENEPFRLPNGKTVGITCSLGLSTSSADSGKEQVEAQIRKADIALYESKRRGRNRVTAYQEGLTSAEETA